MRHKATQVIQLCEVDLPIVPNFLCFHSPKVIVRVGFLKDKELRRIGRLWTLKLLERVTEQRKESHDAR